MARAIQMISLLVMFYLVFMGPLQGINPIIGIGLVIGVPLLIEVVASLLTNNNAQAKKKTSESNKNTPQKQRGLDDEVPHHRELSKEEILKLPIEKLSWREFEVLLFMYFKDKGYKPQETSAGADGGVDLIIYNRNEQAYEAVQIKQYIRSGKEITVKELRELNSAKRNHNCLLARFITSSRFSNEAMKQADDFNIKTHSIDWINNKVIPWKEDKRQ